MPAATGTSNGWTTSASGPTSVAPGGVATLRVSVTSTTTRAGLVDIEVYGPSGRPFQQYLDDQSFAAGVRRTFTVNWTVPAGQAPGNYVVKVGMFGPGGPA